MITHSFTVTSEMKVWAKARPIQWDNIDRFPDGGVDIRIDGERVMVGLYRSLGDKKGTIGYFLTKTPEGKFPFLNLDVLLPMYQYARDELGWEYGSTAIPAADPLPNVWTWWVNNVPGGSLSETFIGLGDVPWVKLELDYTQLP